MRIINNTDNKGFQPNFQKAIFIDLSELPRKKRNAFLTEFKSIIGNGPIGRTYKYNGKTFNQDIFVGYNQQIDGIANFSAGAQRLKNGKIQNILIGTGRDETLGEKLNTKIEQIDNELIGNIKKILDKFGVLSNKQEKLLVSDEKSGEVYHAITNNGRLCTDIPSNSIQDAFLVYPKAKHIHTAVSITPNFLNKISKSFSDAGRMPYSAHSDSKTNPIYMYKSASMGRKYKLLTPFYEYDWNLLKKKD